MINIVNVAEKEAKTKISMRIARTRLQGGNGIVQAKSETKIVQVVSKKKYYADSQGNPIPEDDKEAMADLASGKTVVYYHEQKADENKDKVVSLRKYKISWSDLM